MGRKRVWDCPDRGLCRGFILRDQTRPGCLCGVMACERDVLPQCLREGITRFFAEHLVWLQRVLEAGVDNGTIRQGIDPAAQAKLILSALKDARTMLGRLFGEKSGFDAAIDALGKSLR